MSQHRTLQVKSMFLHIAEHFFDPHPAPIILQGHTQIGQISRQTPGFFLTPAPMDQQTDRINFFDGQITCPQPETFARLVDETVEGLPTVAFIGPDPGITFLTQDIEPMPLIQLSQDRHRAKFAVADHENGCSTGDQLANIRQQSQLFLSPAVSSDLFDPGPDNGDGSFSVSQADHQQLMTKTNLSAIPDQANFSQVPELSFQPFSSNGFIPFTHSNSGIIQQPAQSSRSAQQPGRARNLPGNTAKAHRSALIDTYDQPDKITDLSYALSRSQFHNSSKPGIIEVVGWHWVSPLLEWLFTTKSSAESIPTNYSFTKVSGG